MIFNKIGFVIVILGGVLAAVLAWFTGHYRENVMWFWAGAMIAADLTYRWIIGRRLIHPSGGGWVFFVPVWCIGLALLFLQVVNPGWLE